MSETKGAESASQGKEVKKAAGPFDVFSKIQDRIVEMHGEDWFRREASFMLQRIDSDEYLQATTISSRVAALLQLANTGLTLNPLHKLVYMLRRNVKVKSANGDKWEARLVIEPSYMGLIKAATDTGSVKLIRAEIIYEGDRVQFLKGTTIQVIHSPYWQEKNPRGKVVAAYSVATLHDGTIDVLDMGADVLGQVKAASESVKKGTSSPYDGWEEEMFRKAPIRRHLKTLPKTDVMDRLFHAIGADEEQFGSGNAEQNRMAEVGKEAREVQLQLAEALDTYQGEDREVIREQVSAKIKAKEFTADYGRRILQDMAGETGKA